MAGKRESTPGIVQGWTELGAMWDIRNHGRLGNVLLINPRFHSLLPHKSGISGNSQPDSSLQFHLFPKSPNPKFPAPEGVWKEGNPILELSKAWSNRGAVPVWNERIFGEFCAQTTPEFWDSQSCPHIPRIPKIPKDFPPADLLLLAARSKPWTTTKLAKVTKYLEKIPRIHDRSLRGEIWDEFTVRIQKIWEFWDVNNGVVTLQL